MKTITIKTIKLKTIKNHKAIEKTIQNHARQASSTTARATTGPLGELAWASPFPKIAKRLVNWTGKLLFPSHFQKDFVLKSKRKNIKQLQPWIKDDPRYHRFPPLLVGVGIGKNLALSRRRASSDPASTNNYLGCSLVLMRLKKSETFPKRTFWWGYTSGNFVERLVSDCLRQRNLVQRTKKGGWSRLNWLSVSKARKEKSSNTKRFKWTEKEHSAWRARMCAAFPFSSFHLLPLATAKGQRE